jgi:hypothetical protein
MTIEIGLDDSALFQNRDRMSSITPIYLRGLIKGMDARRIDAAI